jgi:hypothetical protein
MGQWFKDRWLDAKTNWREYVWTLIGIIGGSITICLTHFDPNFDVISSVIFPLTIGFVFLANHAIDSSARGKKDALEIRIGLMSLFWALAYWIEFCIDTNLKYAWLLCIGGVVSFFLALVSLYLKK